MSTGFIEDGYTRDDGYIAAAEPAKSGERFYPALEFSYRIATRNEIIRHDAEIENELRNIQRDPECGVRAEALACEFVAKRISKWSLKNSKDAIVPINAANCVKVHSQLFYRIYQIVRNMQLSDPKPPAMEPPISDEELEKN